MSNPISNDSSVGNTNYREQEVAEVRPDANEAEAEPLFFTAAYELRFSSSLTAARLRETAPVQLQQDDPPPTIGPLDYTFGYGDGSHVPPDTVQNINGDAAEAAAFVLDTFGGGSPEARLARFNAVLEMHKGDDFFIRNFFNTLGPAEVAAMMNTAANPRGDGTPADAIARFNQNIADALSLLAEEGLLNQTDMQKLVSQLTAESGWLDNANLNPWLATDLVGKAGSEQLKNMFFEAATARALEVQQSDPRLASELMAGAAHVLSQTSTSNQAAQLNTLRGAGSLDEFVKLAMQGEASFGNLPTLASASRGMYGEPTPLNMHGVSSLMFNVAFEKYNDFGPGASSADLQRIQVEMFNAATDALNDPRSGEALTDHYADSTIFKDALTAVFKGEFDAIIRENTLAAGGADRTQNYDGNLSTDGHGRIEKLFQLALFTPPGGSYQTVLADFVATRMDALAQSLQSGNMRDFQGLSRDGNGFSQTEGARLLGELLGMVHNGLKDAVTAAKGDRDREIAATKGFLDVVASLIPLPAGRLITQVGLTTVAESIKSFGTQAAAERLVDEGRLDNAGVVDQLYNGVLAQMGNLSDVFKASYGAVKRD